MATFAVVYTFADNEAVRLETRPKHREYLKGLLDAGNIVLSGPFVDDSGALLVIEAGSLAEVEGIVANDPYRAAGVVDNALVREWNIVMRGGQ
ncbi:MAG: YciI family protein [Chloroflexota bacterium]|nr:YciI family protein [Chloroflexota bacterium]